MSRIVKLVIAMKVLYSSVTRSIYCLMRLRSSFNSCTTTAGSSSNAEVPPVRVTELVSLSYTVLFCKVICAESSVLTSTVSEKYSVNESLVRLILNPVSRGRIKSAVNFVTFVAFITDTMSTGLFVISVISWLEKLMYVSLSLVANDVYRLMLFKSSRPNSTVTFCSGISII